MMKNSTCVFIMFVILFLFAGCSSKKDYKDMFWDFSKNHIKPSGEYTANSESYRQLCNREGSCIRYDFTCLDTQTEEPYRIKSIQFVDKTIDLEKPYLLSYPEHTVSSDYGEDLNRQLKDKYQSFLKELDVDEETLDGFMIWLRTNDDEPMVLN